MSRSTDGANNWEEVFTNAHVDHHAMFIHPEFDLVFNGNDGGVNPVSYTHLTLPTICSV